MKQPKKIPRVVREEILKKHPQMDLTKFMLVDVTKGEFMIQNKQTKELTVILR